MFEDIEKEKICDLSTLQTQAHTIIMITKSLNMVRGTRKLQYC